MGAGQHGWLFADSQMTYARFQGKSHQRLGGSSSMAQGERVEIFRREYHQLPLHYLPAYHPEPNYQETLWSTIRYEETTNAFFETIEILELSVFKRSQRWKSQKIKSLCLLI